MRNTSKYSRMGRVFQEVNPELFYEAEVVQNPERRDTSLIPSMYTHYITNYTVDKWTHKRLFTAAILQLFCPSSLHYKLIVTNRICTILAEEFGFKDRQGVSNLIPDIRSNMKVSSFKVRVDGLCEDLKGCFHDRPVSQLQVSLFEMGE